MGMHSPVDRHVNTGGLYGHPASDKVGFIRNGTALPAHDKQGRTRYHARFMEKRSTPPGEIGKQTGRPDKLQPTRHGDVAKEETQLLYLYTINKQ